MVYGIVLPTSMIFQNMANIGINVDSRHGAAPSGRHTRLTLSDTNCSIISVIDTNYITIVDTLIGMYLISFLWSSWQWWLIIIVCSIFVTFIIITSIINNTYIRHQPKLGNPEAKDKSFQGWLVAVATADQLNGCERLSAKSLHHHFLEVVSSFFGLYLAVSCSCNKNMEEYLCRFPKMGTQKYWISIFWMIWSTHEQFWDPYIL